MMSVDFIFIRKEEAPKYEARGYHVYQVLDTEDREMWVAVPVLQ